MIRKGIKPGFRFGSLLPLRRAMLRRDLPFRRNWIAIGVLAAFDVAFLVPAILTFQQAYAAWSRFESLFDLVGAVFLTAWLLGWSTAPVLMSVILLLMLFGREVLSVRPGKVEIAIGVPPLGLAAIYDAARMRNLRYAEPPPKSGTSWRGSHLAFDYGANTVEVGSNLGRADVQSLISGIQAAARTAIRSGEARPEEVAEPWEKEPPVVETLSATPDAEVDWINEPPSLTSLSSLLLIAANLVPVAGAVFLGWALSDVMVLYWAESAIIGFYNLLKMIAIGRWAALFAGPFFVGHFGGFMAVHFLFIYTLFVKGVGSEDMGGSMSDVWALFVSLWPALLALFVSHGYSFLSNFMGRQEYKRRTIKQQMGEPYSRIVFMHLVLILGGGLSLALGGPTLVLIGVIALKIFFDLRAHIREHGGRNPATASGKPRKGAVRKGVDA